MRVRSAFISLVVLLAGVGFLSTPGYCPPPASAGGQIAAREFARMVEGLSEPEGYFDSDNLISNEAGYLKILHLLETMGIRGRVYLGVGPDQNYSYIAEVQPELAFIVDIRRENLLEHLYYKALFALSSNRVEFLQRLFGRNIYAAGLRSPEADIDRLVTLVERGRRDAESSRRSIREAEQWIRSLPLKLSSDDMATIDYIANTLADSGPELRFTSYHRPPRPWYPTYKELLLATDNAGLKKNYLASEERFRRIRRLHGANRIVPVVADLSGGKAMRNIARELRARRLEVSCFYTSNVEFYLFGRQRWPSYVENMRALPWARNAVVIRTFSNTWRPHPSSFPGFHMTTVIQRVTSFFENEEKGRNASYWDLVTVDYLAPSEGPPPN